MNSETRAQVRALISDFMEKWIADSIPATELERIAEEGVSPRGLLTPFHDALVPGITLLGERSFSTRLGNLHEKIAAAIAAEIHADVRQPHDLTGAIPVLSREFITQRLLTALAIRRQESTRTWWGVPYNPYGRGEYRWVYPLAFFDFEHEVMLGERL